MSYLPQIIKERFDIDVTSANKTFKASFELDKNAFQLLGISITSNRDDLLFYRGSQKIQMNDKELFPEGFESKLLMSGLNVAPDARMITLDKFPCGNGIMDVWFTDLNHALAPFVAYRVSIYTFCIVKEVNGGL